MSLKQQLDALEDAEGQKARRKYLDLLRRYDDPRAGDAEKMFAAMKALDLTSEEVDADAGIIREARDCERLAAELEDRKAAHNQANTRVHDLKAAFEKLEKKHRQKHHDLEAAAYLVQIAFDEARTAKQRLAELRRDHAELLAPLDD